MFVYRIPISQEENTFRTVCQKIEASLPHLLLNNKICDIDGTRVWVYRAEGHTVTVLCEEGSDTVCVESDRALALWEKKREI